MRINQIGVNRINFKSTRTDINTVKTLKTGTLPISENKKINIYNSLANISKAPDRAGIEVLLDVADNLAYGQGGNSEYKSLLNATGNTPEERENTDWTLILKNTIEQALNTVDEQENQDLKAKFEQIFNGGKKELTPVQKEILDIRNNLLTEVLNYDKFEDETSLLHAANIRKNLDYFAASSEISAQQKKECFEKFVYFLSDDYKIQPQLEDKKLQALDEILTDMLVKTPESEILTTKDIDQRQSGICAAISICRKALAYEDKVRYLDVIMQELSASPYMEVFDITALGSGKKVNIEKADINYDSALSRGYRIIDASAHTWMQNAHASGDGTILTEKYTAFDEDNYGIYDDSSWYEGLGEEYQTSKNFLKALIKEREELKLIDKKKKEIKALTQGLYSSKEKLLNELSSISALTNKMLGSIFPDYSNEQVTALYKNIIKFYKGNSENNEVNIPQKLDKSLKVNILSDYIKSQVPDITETQTEKLSELSEKIYNSVSAYCETENNLDKAKKYSSKTAKYRYNQNLYRAAAAHRIAIEADLDMPDGEIRYEKALGLEPENYRGADYLRKISASLASEDVRKKYAQETSEIPSKEELEKELNFDILKLESLIPAKFDRLLDDMLGKSLAQLLSDMFAQVKTSILEEDETSLHTMAANLRIKPDSKEVIKKIEDWQQKLSDNEDKEYKNVSEAARILGFKNITMAVNAFVASFYKSLQSGISEEEFERLSNKYGQENLSAVLENLRNEFFEIKEEYENIFSKWDIPSSKSIIIKRFEKENLVLSRSKLNKLKQKFDFIANRTAYNSMYIQNIKARKKANEKVMNFSNEEQAIFEQIEKSLPEMKSYSKRSYNSMNNMLFDKLEEQYAYIGKLNGQFWVREEGSSGLTSNEQLRIIEQITGRPYHIESDITEAVKVIKEGEGSGIISTSVDDTDYAFHAQYVPAVTEETFTNPLTGKNNKEDVLWTDNSWGYAEKEHYWNGRDGHEYTDYGNGWGWKDGFIVDKSMKIGQPVRVIKGAVGVEKEEQVKFGLYNDMILPGAAVRGHQKIFNLINSMLNTNKCAQRYEALEKAIAQGYKLSPDYLEHLDEGAQLKAERLEKRLEKEINSKEDFDKLQDNDDLKIIMEKISLYMSTDNPILKNMVAACSDMEELSEVKKDFMYDYIDTFKEIMGKSEETLSNIKAYIKNDFINLYKEIVDKYSEEADKQKMEDVLDQLFDGSILNDNKFNGNIDDLENILLNHVVKTAFDNLNDEEAAIHFIDGTQKLIKEAINKGIRINSLESPNLVNNPLSEYFIAAIDKYLNPKSDEELLNIIQSFQKADNKTAEDFLNALTEEDFGLFFKPAYDYLERYKAEDSAVIRVFNEIAGIEEIYDFIRMSGEDDEDKALPDEIYRDLYVKLTNMDVQKYVKNFKAEAFEKYKLRQAFPQPVVISDDDIITSANNFITEIRDTVGSIFNYDETLELFSLYTEFCDNHKDDEIYKSMLEGKKVDVNQEYIESLKSELTPIYQYLCKDETFKDITNPLANMISYLSDENSLHKNMKRFNKCLKTFTSNFDDFLQGGLTIDRTIGNKNDELKTFKQNISLYVNSTIQAKYRNGAIIRVKNLINLYKNNAPQDEIDYAYYDFIGYTILRHITKNPVALLNECVKDVQKGKKDTLEYKYKKEFLQATLRVAQQTNIQYSLVKNQHEGIDSKIKDVLPYFVVYKSEGNSSATTVDELNESSGINYLIAQLDNAQDNHTTLNLFLEQAGLSRDAVNALIENFNIEKMKKLTNEKAAEIIQDSADLKVLKGVHDDYYRKAHIRYKSIEDAFNQFASYAERKTRKHSNSKLIQSFIYNLRNTKVQENTLSPNGSLFKEFMQMITLELLDSELDKVNGKFNYIAELYNTSVEFTDLINAIKVPQDSSEYKAREEFVEKINEAKQYCNQVLGKLSQVVEATNGIKFDSNEEL